MCRLDLVLPCINYSDQLNRKELELRNKGLITSAAVQQRLAGGDMAGETGAVLGASRIAQLETNLQHTKVCINSLLTTASQIFFFFFFFQSILHHTSPKKSHAISYDTNIHNLTCI